MTRPDDDLRAFLTAWLAWAEREAVKPTPCRGRSSLGFTSIEGLCTSAAIFNAKLAGRVDRVRLQSLLRQTGAGPDSLFPFGGRQRYLEDQFAGKMHLNAERLAWVRKVLA